MRPRSCVTLNKKNGRWQEVRGAEQPLRRGLGTVQAVRSVIQKG